MYVTNNNNQILTPMNDLWSRIAVKIIDASKSVFTNTVISISMY